MTPREKQLWIRAQRRASSLSPDMSRSIIRAIESLRSDLSDREMVDLIEKGYLDQLIDDVKVKKAFEPLSEEIQKAVAQATKQFSKDLSVSGGFNVLNPDIIAGIRFLDTKVVKSLSDDIRESVRAFAEQGLRNGDSPKELARAIRPMIGLGPSQLEQVQNYREALEKGESLTRFTLRDKRYKGDSTPEKIDRMVATYMNRRIAQNAETIARTASLDAMKLGQKLSVDSAIERGIYDGNTLTKKWVGVLDDRERDEHIAMEGETVPYNYQYSNGEDVPGESTYNCRCISVYHT